MPPGQGFFPLMMHAPHKKRADRAPRHARRIDRYAVAPPSLVARATQAAHRPGEPQDDASEGEESKLTIIPAAAVANNKCEVPAISNFHCREEDENGATSPQNAEARRASPRTAIARDGDRIPHKTARHTRQTPKFHKDQPIRRLPIEHNTHSRKSGIIVIVAVWDIWSCC
jgi:hypothetical protein